MKPAGILTAWVVCIAFLVVVLVAQILANEFLTLDPSAAF